MNTYWSRQCGTDDIPATLVCGQLFHSTIHFIVWGFTVSVCVFKPLRKSDPKGTHGALPVVGHWLLAHKTRTTEGT